MLTKIMIKQVITRGQERLEYNTAKNKEVRGRSVSATVPDTCEALALLPNTINAHIIIQLF